MSWRADQERAGGSRTSSGAIVSFGLAAIALGVLPMDLVDAEIPQVK
jgi:hypothetical protein